MTALLSDYIGTMLARPEIKRCIECGTPYGAPTFWYQEGIAAHGPAYWSDRGVLCSPSCSLAHFRRREAEGTLQQEPAIDPFEFEKPSFGR